MDNVRNTSQAQKHVLDGLKYSCYNNRDHYHNTMTTQLGIPMSPLKMFSLISSQPPSLPFNGQGSEIVK